MAGTGDSPRDPTSGAKTVRLYAVEPRSDVNGPGTRFVIWFQGCEANCPGCFNPQTHARDGGEVVEVESLLRRIDERREGLDGVSITGGEPFEQPEPLLALADRLRSRTGLSLLIFSGFTVEQIRSRPLGDEILRRTDILIDGPYVEPLGPCAGLRGSANQHVHLLGDHHAPTDLVNTPSAELIIDPSGRISITGIDPPKPE